MRTALPDSQRSVIRQMDSTMRRNARYKIGGRAYRMHKTGRFVRVEGRWNYLDGEVWEG